MQTPNVYISPPTPSRQHQDLENPVHETTRRKHVRKSIFQSICSDWDTRVMDEILVFIILIIISAFVFAFLTEETEFALYAICENRLAYADKDNGTLVVALTLSTMGSSVVSFFTGAFVAFQCSKSTKKLNEDNVLLTSAFILPCYERIWWSITTLSGIGVILSASMLRVTSNNHYQPQLDIPCSVVEIPSGWISMIVPVLMVQKSVSPEAVNRALICAGLHATGYAMIVFSTWTASEIVFSSLLACFWGCDIMFYLWAISKSHARYAFRYFFVVSFTILVLLFIRQILFLQTADRNNVASILYVISQAIEHFETLAILLTMRADTKFWLGLDALSSRTSEDALQEYLSQTSSAGMVTTFSTRTSVYGVHSMIEEHRKSVISHSSLRLTEVIAHGATAMVLRGYLRTNQPVAVKMYTSLQVTDDEVYQFSKETAFNTQLHHPNIVKFYGLCVVPPTISLVFEYCERGDLSALLKKSPQCWTLSMKYKAWVDAAKAVAYLHSFNPPLLHRDIKTGNFLVSADFTVKLTDFGEAHLLQPRRDGTMSIAGTVDYMAPELIRGSRTACYGVAADVYSLGLCFWEMHFPGESPWGTRSHLQVYDTVLSGQRPTLPASMSEASKALLRRCWAHDPSQRPSAAAVVGAAERLLSLSRHQRGLSRATVLSMS